MVILRSQHELAIRTNVSKLLILFVFFERVHTVMRTGFLFFAIPRFDLGNNVNISSQICYAADVANSGESYVNKLTDRR